MGVRDGLIFLNAMIGVFTVQTLAVGAAWALGARETFLRRYLPLFVSLAVGVLLATAMLHLMPEAIATLGNGQAVWMVAGVAMLGLFLGERVGYLLTGTGVEPELKPLEDCAEYAHGHEHGHHGHATRPGNILAASMLHSLIDGAAVATAFAASPRIGWLTTFAIALHEIPHRMGDFALFVHLRVPARAALRMAVLAGAPSLVGMGLVAAAGMQHAERIAWLLPVSAGSFLYIAMVNLLPEIERERSVGRLVVQMATLCAGVALVVLAGGIFPS